MKSSDITKKMLEGLAKTFNNNIVAKSDPLPDGSKDRIEITGADGKKVKVRVTRDFMLSEIKNAAEALLQEGDKDVFSDDEISLMKVMEIDVDTLFSIESEPEDVKCDCETEPVKEEVAEVKEEEKPVKKTVKKNKKAEKPKKEDIKLEEKVKTVPKKTDAVKKEVGKSKKTTRAIVFSELIYEKKKMTKEEIINEMSNRYNLGSGSKRQSELSVGRYIRVLEAMGLFDIIDGEYVINISKKD